MSLRAKVASGLKWQAVTILGRQLLSLVVFTALARLLEPAAFGLVGLVGVYLAFISLIAEQGIGTALIQRKILEREHLDTAFWFNLGCASCLCGLTIAFAPPIAVLFGEPDLAPLLRWCSLSVVVGASASIHGSLLVKSMDFKKPAARTLLANSVGGVAGVTLAINGYGVWALVVQQITASCAGAAFLWRVSPYRPRVRFSFRHLRDLLGISSSVFGTSVLWFASSRLDQLIIGKYAGAPALGLYVIAGKLPEMARMFTHQPTAEVSLPALAQMQGDLPRMQSAIYKGMEVNAAISCAVFTGLAAVAPQLVPFVFGQKWAAAADLCALLSIYALVNALQVFFHPALLASGGAGRYLILNVWHSAGVLVSCLIGIRYGTNFLVCALIANGILVALGALIFLRARIGLSAGKYLKPCIAPAAAAMLMFVAVRGADMMLPSSVGSLPRLICGILGGAGVYMLALFILAPKAFQSVADIGGGVLKKLQKPVKGLDLSP